MVQYKGDWIYTRECETCGEFFKTEAKFGITCDSCKKKKAIIFKQNIRDRYIEKHGFEPPKRNLSRVERMRVQNGI